MRGIKTYLAAIGTEPRMQVHAEDSRVLVAKLATNFERELPQCHKFFSWNMIQIKKFITVQRIIIVRAVSIG